MLKAFSQYQQEGAQMVIDRMKNTKSNREFLKMIDHVLKNSR